MKEEEKEALERIEKWLNKEESYCTDEDIKTVLNLIKTQKAELERLKKQSKNLDKEAQAYLEQLAGDSGMKERTIALLQAELEKKDGIIKSMAECIYEEPTFGYGKLKDINTPEKITDYFTKLAEEEK